MSSNKVELMWNIGRETGGRTAEVTGNSRCVRSFTARGSRTGTRKIVLSSLFRESPDGRAEARRPVIGVGRKSATGMSEGSQVIFLERRR